MKRGPLLGALLLASPASAGFEPGYEMATFVMQLDPDQRIEARMVAIPDWACRQYVDYFRDHGNFELTFGEPLAKTDHPVTGRVGNVICVRQDGTAYDRNGETEAPNLVPSGNGK